MSSASNVVAVLANLLVGIAIAMLSAKLSVSLALRRFHAEKTWERRLELYIQMLECLHRMKTHSAVILGHRQIGTIEDAERNAELASDFRNAFAELRKLEDIGELILDSEAVALVARLRSDMNSIWSKHIPDTSDEGLLQEHNAIVRTIVDLRAVAAKDVGSPSMK